MKIAPYTAPEIDARPPITMPTSKVIDRKMVKLSGRDELHRDRAERPSDARVHRAHPKGERLVQRIVHAHGFRSNRLVADGDERTSDPPAQ